MNKKVAIVVALTVAIIQLSSCAIMQAPKAKIPTEIISARGVAHGKRMVIVLPGIGDTIAVMKNSGVIDVIQRSMPDATVTLVEFSWAYYMEGRSAQRLHDEVVKPALQKGYRDIYLVGASLGGMGALMYEGAYPDEMRGLILIAPFMGVGAGSMLKEIEAAGGLTQWQPGPRRWFSGRTAPREQWRVVRSWMTHPQRAQNVYLVCGQEDRMHTTVEIISSMVPSKNYFTLPGGHTWKVWTQGAAEAFAAIGTDSG